MLEAREKVWGYREHDFTALFLKSLTEGQGRDLGPGCSALVVVLGESLKVPGGLPREKLAWKESSLKSRAAPTAKQVLLMIKDCLHLKACFCV